MRAVSISTAVFLLAMLISGGVYGGYEGSSNTFYGKDAGFSTLGDDDGCTFIGAGAGYTNTGLYNTFIGRSAGYFNGDGEGNTFIGYGAGVGNTASDNTFIGKWAGRYNSDGHSNTFIGLEAGHSTTNGNANTIIGSGAGRSNTTGFSNTFIGRDAGFSNEDADSNTFVGYAAGRSNTTGHNNSFFGINAGTSNTTGILNTFLGSSAGRNSTGTANVFAGYAAGYGTTGDNNSFFGNWTGYNNTSGGDNTFIGYYAGYSNTTGFGNIFLGHRAGYSADVSNRLFVDNSSTSTPLIYGEFDNRKLTVNGNLEVIGPDNGLVRLSNVTTDNTTKASRMVLNHYSNAQSPVYLFGAASTASDNFVAFGGGNPVSVPAVAATQIDLFTAPNTTTPTGSPRITIKGNGYVGIGTQTPSYPLQMAGGAYSNGGSWINGSSRDYKANIKDLKMEDAVETLKGLNPVTFNYKTSPDEGHVGFIAEEVPDLVATKDRRGLSPMDLVAVLTKVLQEQQKINQEQQRTMQEQREAISNLVIGLNELKRELGGKIRRTGAGPEMALPFN